MQVRQVPGPAKERLEKALKDLNKSKVTRVGWFETNRYPNGTPVAYVATIHEFGVPEKGIPPRPFMRPTIAEQRLAWIKKTESGAKAILAGNETVATVMEKLGQQVEGDIRETITKLTTPALKDSTVAARKRKMADGKTTGLLTKPLVETATLLDTITHTVSDE